MKWLLSISYCEHDASICLLRDNNVELFIQEERSSRIKRDSSFPLSCLKYVKEYTNVIDLVVFGNLTKDPHYECNGVLNYFFKDGIKILDHHIDFDHHHIYHAASGFYNSHFEEAAVVVIDGWGGLGERSIGKGSPSGDLVKCAETTSIYHAKYPSKFDLIFKNYVYEPELVLEVSEELFEKQELKERGYICNLTNHLDIGVIYGIASNVLGFTALDGGKTMGLSSYGKPDSKIPSIFSENKMYCNMNLFKGNREINTKVYPYLKDMTSFEKQSNFAYSIQKALEYIFIQRVNFALKTCETNNIVLSGGCALNVVGNSVLKKKFPNVNFYIDPIPNDAGQSLGLAKYFYHELTNSKEMKPMENLYCGPLYTEEELKNRILNKTRLIN
jgi:predicted NodU family carbamoyl transferase